MIVKFQQKYDKCCTSNTIDIGTTTFVATYATLLDTCTKKTQAS